MSSRGKGYKATIRYYVEGPARGINTITRGKVSPNAISIITFLLHLPVAWLLANCYLGYGGLILLLVAPLDLLDGALARVQNRVSDFGTVLDAVLDRAKEVLIFGALAYHLANNGSSVEFALLVSALGLSILVSYVRAKGEMAIASQARKKVQAAELNRVLEFGLMGYEVRVAVLGFGLIFDQLILALWIIAIGSLITALMRLESIRRQI